MQLGYEEGTSEPVKDAGAAAHRFSTAMTDVARLLDTVDWHPSDPKDPCVTRDQYGVRCEQMAEAAATFREAYDVACKREDAETVRQLDELYAAMATSVQNVYSGLVTRYENREDTMLQRYRQQVRDR